MSRVGKQPIKVAQGVKVNITEGTIRVEGPKGKLSHSIPEGVTAKLEKDELTVALSGSGAKTTALHGTTRSVIYNMVRGCSQGFTKELDIQGVGFRAAVKGKILNLNLGFSHPVDFPLPEGVTAKVDKNTHITLSAADKVLLGETAARIRALRKPEPYQGKGVKYSDERIIRKQGKAAGAK